jgi:hypothetical protein
MQDSENDEQRPAFLDDPVEMGPSRLANDLSPIVMLLAGAIVLGGATGWFLISRSQPDPVAMPMVPSERVAEAIPTLSNAAQIRALRDNRACPQVPLGFITAMTPGNPVGATVSFRTSKYSSPQFHITDKPQRIALPDPLPESGGLDPLSIDGEAKGLLVSLYPTVRIDTLSGTAGVTVRWPARQPCK